MTPAGAPTTARYFCPVHGEQAGIGMYYRPKNRPMRLFCVECLGEFLSEHLPPLEDRAANQSENQK